MLSPSPPIRAVVIGASAGAIDALHVLVPALPRELGIPVVAVVHLPPRQPSLLCELFAPLCKFPVREACHQDQPRGAGLWFAPPDYHLLFETAESFALSVDEPVNFSRPSIDVLFESAADALGNQVLAVVLSGASSDGAKGAEKIRELGGLVAVQSPDNARVPVMPEASIARARPQFVGTVAELADFIVQSVHGSPS